MGPKVCEQCGQEIENGESSVEKEKLSTVHTFGPTSTDVPEPVHFHPACWGRANQFLYRDPT